MFDGRCQGVPCHLLVNYDVGWFKDEYCAQFTLATGKVGNALVRSDHIWFGEKFPEMFVPGIGNVGSYREGFVDATLLSSGRTGCWIEFYDASDEKKKQFYVPMDNICLFAPAKKKRTA